MAISVAEVIRQARVNMLKDVDADDFQFGDKELLDGLNHAIQRALKLKPILKWTDTHTYSDPAAFMVSSAEDEDTVVNLPEHYEEALVMGTCEQVCNSLQADQAMAQAKQKYAEQFVMLMRM